MAERNEIWRYAARSEFSPPRDGSVERLRGLRRLWTATRAVWRGEEKEVAAEDYDRAIADDLEGLLPPPEIDAQVEALGAALDVWPGTGSSAPRTTRVVVGPPGSLTGEVVEQLARQKSWPLLPVPTRRDLVEHGVEVEKILDGVDLAPGEPLTIPRLERWLVRSETGLPTLRRLVGHLRTRSAPLLVGCDSWCWSYLSATIGLGGLTSEPLSLMALDGEQLTTWLGKPLVAAGRICRSTEKPEEILFAALDADPAATGASGASDGGPSTTLVRLAAAARGNPGVALELWRRCLRVAHQEREAEERQEPGGPASPDPDALWAAPLKRSEVIVSPRLQSEHKFLLFAVLVHGGIEAGLLPELLPFASHDVSRWLLDLVDERLLSEEDGEVAVPLSAYPAVREDLEGEGFLVDDF